jgi:uncharacterized protein
MIIQVKVIPKSSQNAIVGFEGDVLKIKCTAVPEKGKANEAVIALLAKHYKVPKSAIKIIKGASSSKKIIDIQEDVRMG